MTLNSLWMDFQSRLKSYIKQWCTSNVIDQTFVHPIICHENGWTCRKVLIDQMIVFVSEQRNIHELRDRQRVSDFWLKQHPKSILLLLLFNTNLFGTVSGQYKVYSGTNICDQITFYDYRHKGIVFHGKKDLTLQDKVRGNVS